MKFSKTLRTSIYPPWKAKYLDYDKLKILLREDEAPSATHEDSSWTEQDEENFVNELTNVQLEKVFAHQTDTFSNLKDRTAACEEQLKPTADSDASQEQQRKIAESTLKELDGISKEITELKKFSRVNYTGFLKAAKKHDRKRGKKYRCRPILQVRMSQAPFNNEDYSPLLYRLSTMYAWCRQILDGEDPRKESRTSVRPKDTYTVRKFWVHQDNLLEVKTYILRRLPVLVYNPQSIKVVDASQKDPTITSIYFDSEKFDLYNAMVDRAEESGSLRLRWTGQLADTPEILLEKKTVNEKTGNRDIRIQIKQKYVESFIKGEYKMEKNIGKLQDRYGADSEEVKDYQQTVGEIQDFIKDQGLEPMLRATYQRTAFQIPGDDRIRISLDTNVALIREDDLDHDRPCREPDSWHRTDIDDQQMEYPYSSVKKGEIHRFEHAILEIKVRDSKYTQNNSWLNDLISSHLVKEAPRFSKFVHGIAELFEDHVNSFPFWLSDLETDIRREPVEAYQEEQDRMAKRAEDEIAVGSFITTSKLSSSQRNKFGSPTSKTPARQSVSKSDPFVNSKLSQMDPTVEERESADDDDDGVQGHDAPRPELSNAGRLRSLLPAFSNSRYAQRHRKGAAYRDAPLPAGVKDMRDEVWIKDQGPLKVEAKVWLANQRTFIKWLHVSVLLGSLSLGLYNAAGVDNDIARVLSVVYTLFAVFTAVWGLGVYQWRSRLITQRSGRDFDAMLGPIVVTVGLAAALVLNFVFKYQAARQATEGTGLLRLGLNMVNSTVREELK